MPMMLHSTYSRGARKRKSVSRPFNDVGRLSRKFAKLNRSTFVRLARSWVKNPARQFLGFIWLAYRDLIASKQVIDGRDWKEASPNCWKPRVRDAMSGDEPFYVQHGPFERETMRAPPAQPPEYDLAFVLRADARSCGHLKPRFLRNRPA